MFIPRKEVGFNICCFSLELRRTCLFFVMLNLFQGLLFIDPETVLDYWRFSTFVLRFCFSLKNSAPTSCSPGRRSVRAAHFSLACLGIFALNGVTVLLSASPSASAKIPQNPQFGMTNSRVQDDNFKSSGWQFQEFRRTFLNLRE